jgi:hypothetical protein
VHAFSLVSIQVHRLNSNALRCDDLLLPVSSMGGSSFVCGIKLGAANPEHDPAAAAAADRISAGVLLTVGKSGLFEPSANDIGAAATAANDEPTTSTAAAAAASASATGGQAEDSDSDNSQDARAVKKQAKLDARRVRFMKVHNEIVLRREAFVLFSVGLFFVSCCSTFSIFLLVYFLIPY